MASITEVARLAGVSPATASRVVSASGYPVSAATRARVLEAARTLDYVPNALARGLLKSYVPVVAVMVHDITDPYFAEVVRGVEDGASSAGYLVITCSSERDADRERSYVRLLRSIRAAAVVFAGSGLDDPVANEEMDRHLSAMRADGAAVVHLSPHARGRAGGRRRQRGRGGVDGRARWSGSGTGGSRSSPGRRRCTSRASGWRATGAGLADAGHRRRRPADPDDGLRCRGAAWTPSTRCSPATPRSRAICCANDLLALGALQRLAELGIDVPGAMSVAGFDDISTAAHHGSEPVHRAAPAARARPARVRARGPRAGRRGAGARAAADRGGAARARRPHRPVAGRTTAARPATPAARAAKAS